MSTANRRRPASHRPKLGAMSVSLLNQLMHDTLDPGYAEAARRRDEAEPAACPPRRSRATSQTLTAVALLLVGAILGLSYRETQRQAPQSERAREALVRDVERETATSGALQRRAETLAAQLADERDSALAKSQAGDAAGQRLRTLETTAGLTAVTGPGMTVILGDAQPRTQTDPLTGQPVVVPPDENGRILDRDIQSIVNALWASGAEAISVDGERLSATTPIRAAGDAILVDLYPVTSPYRIEAIGDPDSMLPRFVDSAAARRFQTYVGTFGIQLSVQRSDLLRLRAATESTPHYADPLSGSGATPGDRPSTGSSGGGIPDSDSFTPTAPEGPGTPTFGGGR